MRAYREALAARPPDLVLLDYLLPDGRADALLVSPPEAGPCPMVLMTSHGDEAVAVDAMRRGALDYVVKSPEAFAAMPRTAAQALRSWQLLMDRKQAEDRVRQLSRAVEQNPASIVITDLSGAIEYVNPKFTEVTGYSFEEVRGQNPRLLKSGEMPPDQYRQLWETISNGGEWHGEFHNQRKDGALFWEQASISPIMDAAGRITHYVAVKEDITEWKRVEAALRDSEERHRHLMETTSDWIWEIDANNRYTYASPKVAELLGYSPQEILGRSPFALMPEPEAQRVAAVFVMFAGNGGRFPAWRTLIGTKMADWSSWKPAGCPSSERTAPS